MKSEDQQQPAAEGPATRPGTRARDFGSADNTNPGEKHDTIVSQTKTTRRLDRAVKRHADDRMSSEDKAVGRWEGEGGSTPQAKKGVRK